jgi:hypothetical protein
LPDSEDDEKSLTARAVNVAKVGVPLTAAVIGLLFAVKPELKPCLGETAAELTGAPVFPGTSYNDNLRRSGLDPEPRDQLGAVARVSYRVDGLKGKTLTLKSSLVTVKRDGSVGRVVKEADWITAGTFKVKDCSETGGNDVFVQFVERGKRYRLVLELYRDGDDRIALRESENFVG